LTIGDLIDAVLTLESNQPVRVKRNFQVIEGRLLSRQRKPVFVEFADNYAVANKVADKTSADLVLVSPKFEASIRRSWRVALAS
jgi:hypothetical protein